MTDGVVSREDLDFLRRLATLPSTGTIGERNRLIRCARIVAAWLDAPDLIVVPLADLPAEVKARPDPILGPGQG